MKQVSILARPEGRALPLADPIVQALHAFQSSPVPKDGRYVASAPVTGQYSVFQSSPVPKDGRYL